MKKLFFNLLMLASFSSFAGTVDYTCGFRQYQINITFDEMSTNMFLIDRLSHETIYVGYVGWIETQGNFQKYHFYPSNGRDSILTLNKEDIANQVTRTSGWIDGQFNGWLMYDSIICLKR